MSVIVRDAGFAPEDWAGAIPPLAEAGPADPAIEIAATDGAASLADRLGALSLVRVRFGGFADGRGFTVARDLRAAGYRGRLRAAGPLVADQYAMARRSGFDEVEIDDATAARQPEPQWLARADWRAHDYQARLRG